MNGQVSASKCMREMNECTGKLTNNPLVEPPIRPEAGLSNFVGNQEPLGLPQEDHVIDPLP
jgi:hypothetical protein